MLNKQHKMDNKKFKSVNRAINRGHLNVKFDSDGLSTGRKGFYLTRKTGKGSAVFHRYI